MRKKNFLINIALLLSSTFLLFLILEWGFPKILHKIPLTMYPGLDRELRILGQSSKLGPVPENYIAIVGDSYAQGKGDWLTQVIANHRYRLTTPDYHSAHVLHRMTGRDVVTFGTGGAGSLPGMISEPIRQFRHVDSLSGFELQTPAVILVYFYEGNDFYDNTMDILTRFYNLGWSLDRFFEPDYFREFIEREILKDNQKYDTASPIHNLLFTRFLVKGFDNVEKEVQRGWRTLKKKFQTQPVPERQSMRENTGSFKKLLRFVGAPPAPAQAEETLNQVLVAGKTTTLPVPSQAPPILLTEVELQRATFAFEQALLYMAGFFEGASIKIVYIPAPLSSYPIKSERISHEPYYLREPIADAHLVPETSARVCRLIEAVARKHEMGFVDTRPAIRKAGLKQAMHGPKDWQHLNEPGYRTLAESIVQAFFTPGAQAADFGCREQPLPFFRKPK
ncbi:hypothetical protein UR09_02260 [Candidatus Nitromaritima sp. SCGC AAA799-A02]|nr:hypothetical protein UZ36_06525 [Candidatus Nitromaritima sp. SCGC AAA799-C22]KMP11911.1 hypothetical protein UR09_02260 [Candidatus Nitromaritima sp. SCGC AAA799-A02]